MRRNLPWFLLAVSLALNLGLAAGALYYEAEAERLGGSAEARLDTIAERLALTADQREGLLALRAKIQDRRDSMGSARDQRRAVLLAELAKPELDRAEMSAVMDGGRDERRAFFEALMIDLHGFLATLTPDQKADFLAMAEERYFLRGLFGFGPPSDNTQGDSQAQIRN